MPKNTLKLQIVSLNGIIFEEQVESVYLTGDDGEFELLPFHQALLTSLPEGEIKIANYGSIPIKSGVLMFNENTCRIIAEADPKATPMKQSWSIA